MRLSKRLLRNLNVIKVLAKCKDPVVQRKILENADDDLIACLVECVVNVLQQKVYISKDLTKKLSKHASEIRKIGKTRSRRTAKKILVQEGGGVFLPLLLGPVLTAATSVLSGLISK